AVAEEPLTVPGDGRRSSSFTHVADVVDALLLLLAHPGAHGGTFDIGSDEETTVAALAALVLERSGSPSPL
ncbi:NAD-dependent epimerase/dehydratase family protein, partial [Streptomyces sp. SID14478]|uniref:NAD-dependent epimerase/dehydratase family protein n=1 Tax=Streptomyces sp. SID14478 TaxID=2706073 RepID=UPI0013DF5B88